MQSARLSVFVTKYTIFRYNLAGITLWMLSAACFECKARNLPKANVAATSIPSYLSNTRSLSPPGLQCLCQWSVAASCPAPRSIRFRASPISAAVAVAACGGAPAAGRAFFGFRRPLLLGLDA